MDKYGFMTPEEYERWKKIQQIEDLLRERPQLALN